MFQSLSSCAGCLHGSLLLQCQCPLAFLNSPTQKVSICTQLVHVLQSDGRTYPNNAIHWKMSQLKKSSSS